MRPVTNARRQDRSGDGIDKTTPAPVGGWNARDSIATMGKTDAIRMENWFPRPSYVETRPGSQQYYSGLPSILKTLMVHRAIDGTETMFAASATGIYNASFGGVAGPSLLPIVARTNGKHQWEMFGDGTNNWLIAVNGADKPWYWNGTSYVLVDGASSPAITGLTTTDLVSVAVFKNRLLFIRKNKLGFDYLPAGAAGGAATHYDLSSFASMGGYLMAIAVWTRDAGSGPDDYVVFLTSQGQALVYQGTDPSSASTWALVGTFVIGKPLGRRCVLKYGADPLVLTENGVFPLSALLASGDERQKWAVSYKIQSAFSAAAVESVSVYGWKAISFYAQDALIVNVPTVEDGHHEQYVMNTISKAWCKFTGWHAEDFTVYNGALYYCKGYEIYRAWVGESDETKTLYGSASYEGNDITYIAEQAYQDFGSSNLKEPLMFQPILEASAPLEYSAGINTDFVTLPNVGVNEATTTNYGVWGVSTWGDAVWAPDQQMVRQWVGTASWPGRWLSGSIRMLSKEVYAKWIGSVYRFKTGSGL